jgi:hypothetical protein
MTPSFNFILPRPERSLSEALTAMPRAFREHARKGFAVLARLGRQHYAEILRAVVITLETRQPPLEDLEKRLSITKDELSALMAAAMITVPLLGNGASPEDFTSAAVKVDMLPQDLAAGVLPFMQIVVAERPQLGRAIRRTAMPSQVLPFLAGVDIVVDLRMAF